MQTHLIGSTELGWHPVEILTEEALLTFTQFDGVHLIRASDEGVHLAPSTLIGYANCGECPFTMRDAHKVLEMLRPQLIEAKKC